MGGTLWAKFLLLELLFTIVLYPTRHRVYRAIVLAALIYVAAQSFREPRTIGGKLPLTSRVASRAAFTAYILFAEGSFPNHWRRVRDEVDSKAGPNDPDNPPLNFPLIKKLWWMLDLAYSFRMVGWVQEPRNSLPPRPPPSRLTFLWKTFLKFILNYAVLDLTSLVFSQSPAFDPRVHDPTDGPETYLAAVPLLHRVPYGLVFCAKVEAALCAAYNIAALACVGLGGSDPTLWPEIWDWGNWRDAYTLRNVWGRSWHQMYRLPLAGLGKLVVNKVLKIPRGTILSSYAQLYVVFFLSGIMHLGLFGGDYTFQRRVTEGTMKFFLIQAVAITFEDLVIRIAKRLPLFRGTKPTSGKDNGFRVRAVVRVIGYCWVVLWGCFSMPIWLDEVSALGSVYPDRGPIARFLWGTWERWA